MTSGNIIPPKAQMVMARDFVVRRSELTVPGHSMKMMAKAATSNADQVMFDLEDACAVSQKVEARKVVVEALNTLDFKGKIRAFRPNNIRTRYFYRDLIEVVETAGSNIDVVVIAKCTPRMGGLIFGLVDFVGDIGAQELGGEQFFYYNYAKAKCITAARAAGITVVDGVTLAIRDNEACRRDAQMG